MIFNLLFDRDILIILALIGIFVYLSRETSVEKMKNRDPRKKTFFESNAWWYMKWSMVVMGIIGLILIGTKYHKGISKVMSYIPFIGGYFDEGVEMVYMEGGCGGDYEYYDDDAGSIISDDY